MELFNFLKKKDRKEFDTIGLNEEKELNLFQDNLISNEFLAKVRKLKDVNKKFQKGMNLLHFAAEYSEVNLAKELIKLGVRIEDKNDFGNTPL